MVTICSSVKSKVTDPDYKQQLCSQQW